MHDPAEAAPCNPGRLTGKVAIITGASQGLGAAIAAAFVASGANAMLTDIREPARGSLAAELLAHDRASFTRLDVAAEEEWHAAARACARTFGEPDVLVNNAAIPSVTPDLVSEPLADWNRVIAVNLSGPYLGMRQLIPGMVQRGSGSIINVASVFADRGVELEASYSASKGGLTALTRHAAAAYAAKGIRINAINPGNLQTPMTVTSGGTATPDVELVVGRTPMGRQGLPDEVAAAAVFLASDDASYITGATLPVDGGFSA